MTLVGDRRDPRSGESPPDRIPDPGEESGERRTCTHTYQRPRRPPGFFLKSTLSELLFRNGNIDIETRIRNDNSSVVEHVHSINAVAKGRRLNGFLESNMEGMGGESPVRLIAYNGPSKYSRRNDEIGDPKEGNYIIISPEYFANSK